MKISLISPNQQHLHDAQLALQALGHQVQSFEGGKTRLREVVEQSSPDLAVVDGICCDLAELQYIEQTTLDHPDAAVVLLCSTQTPEFLIGAMRAGVREVLPSPPPLDALRSAIQRLEARREGARRATGRVLATMPVKGGAGATFIAANLAWELAQRHRTLLVDLNLQFGDAYTLLSDQKPAATLADVVSDISRLDASLLSSCATQVTPRLHVLPPPDDLARGVPVAPAHLDSILAVARAEYEFVVIDLPRSLDPLTVRALDAAERVYLVLQAGLPELRNTSRILEAFRGLDYSSAKAELVLNRFERNAELGVEHLERSLGSVKIHTIHNAYREVRASINHGEPLASTGRGGTVTRQLGQLAESVQPKPNSSKSLLGRLFGTA
ncbi:AAA family ATPase [Ramlibacter rhizophilus]|uniref:Histidine kinase n=1 Tax=Ramlibacter rhizophilus TaxID=1781167 RepID=A0A4Z0BDM7_9BURK|nr:AAA family ATPase [Ramlibacter rhizophilus]TFY96900.1 histidine kinase [Ramlibacter rhizophilus]